MISDPASAQPKTRIVFVIDTLTAGGTERHLLRLVEGLVASGAWNVSVYCLSRSGSFVPAMEALGVEVAGPSGAISSSPVSLVAGFLRLYHYFRRERPAIAHCYLAMSGVLGSAAARLARIPHVVTTRRNVYNFTGRKQLLHRVSMGMTSYLSDTVISVCEAARRQGIAEGTSPHKSVTVYNSIPRRHFGPGRLGRFPGQPVIGTLAELHVRKGLIYLIDAVPSILAQLPDARVVIAGKGPELPALQRRIADLELDGRVELPGEVLDIEGFLPELDLFVLPSIREGMPNALMEAMMAGLPVVATSVGGIPELVRDEVTGLLIAPRSPTAIADAVVRFWRDESLRRRCAEEGKRFVIAEFGDVQREVVRHEEIYRRLLGGHGAPVATPPWPEGEQ